MWVVFASWIIGFLAMWWVFADASKRRGRNLGCLWSLIVLILGPLGLVAYLFVRGSD
ncbi:MULTISPECIES: hypothetical protein [Kyrpidia]|uniref:Uncharacterized protein n=2 Tax=Kyrpidia spormannii TaxID=2055160 RepID=A0ACA8Z5C5_9BACL|nr:MULTISPECIES: hypothetical protein [Kyrpidia]MCL6576212.1 hypothetical protein [Kyrpidia sp.]CAB3389855.1 conserved protein of unknown function [Kyrpidia spormannii]CAB3390754.1 conserved protein of unknown function [Kyrpidia spormannii]HHY68525.1 hypothetical protein [Alicyclobacillus sp.]